MHFHPRLTILIGLIAMMFGNLTARASDPGTAGVARPVVIFTKEKIPPSPKLDDLAQLSEVSQYGITWKFATPVRAGHFINGDWYFVGPAIVSAIDPKPLFAAEVTTAPVEERDIHESRYKDQYARNGSTLNMPAVVPRSKITTRTRRCGFD